MPSFTAATLAVYPIHTVCAADQGSDLAHMLDLAMALDLDARRRYAEIYGVEWAPLVSEPTLSDDVLSRRGAVLTTRTSIPTVAGVLPISDALAALSLRVACR